MKAASKTKMQNVSFKSVEEFLDFLPDDELKITEILRELITNCIPDVTEKLSYNVPYYKRKKNICFLWPASVLWGKKKTYEGVRFGFVNGHLLNDDINYLHKGDRKQVYWKDFTTVTKTDLEILKTYLLDAVILDGQPSAKR
jgi:hypothetical protein